MATAPGACGSTASTRSRKGLGRGRGGRAHRALPEILPALRGRGLRHGLSDRRLVQARRGRHRAGQREHLHRLQAVLVGLPLRRARVRPRRRRHEEMHAVHRPHLQREPRARGAPAGLRHGVPDQGAVFRRSRRPEFGRLRPRRDPRRQGSDARTRLSPGQQIPAAEPQPARPRFRRRRRPSRNRSPRPAASCAGSTGCCRDKRRPGDSGPANRPALPI